MRILFAALLSLCASIACAQTDPDYLLKGLQTDLDAGNYKSILTQAAVYQAQCRADGDSRTLKHFYEHLGRWDNHLALNKWTEADASSSVAWTAMAYACYNKGLEFRGNGDEDKVSSENLKIFKEYLNVARFCLDKAIKLNSADPFPYIFSLNVETAGGCRAKYVMQDYFDKALAISPNNYDALDSMSMYHSPMWCGSEKDMADFVKEYVSSRPVGSFSRLIIPSFFKQVWISKRFDSKFIKNEKTWHTINSVYFTFFKHHPENLFYRDDYAFWAFNFRRFYIAKAQFDRMGDEWNSNIWINHEEELKIKKEVEDWVAAHPQKH